MHNTQAFRSAVNYFNIDMIGAYCSIAMLVGSLTKIITPACSKTGARYEGLWLRSRVLGMFKDKCN